jgi:hypothetical protein
MAEREASGELSPRAQEVAKMRAAMHDMEVTIYKLEEELRQEKLASRRRAIREAGLEGDQGPSSQRQRTLGGEPDIGDVFPDLRRQDSLGGVRTAPSGGRGEELQGEERIPATQQTGSQPRRAEPGRETQHGIRAEALKPFKFEGKDFHLWEFTMQKLMRMVKRGAMWMAL